MATLKSVFEKWDFMPSKTRTGELAKALAKTIVLKACNVEGKHFLKSMGEARFLSGMLHWVKKKRLNFIKYEPEVWEYQPEVKHYIPDFKIKVGTSVHYVEYKGAMVKDTRTKMRDVKRCNPDKSIILVFERGKNKLSPKPKSITYMKWAERNGFPAFNTQDSDWDEQLTKWLIDNSILIKEV